MSTTEDKLNFAGEQFEFTFQLSKMTIFEVRYYECGKNGHAHFATSAATFIKSKRDYSMCGQCQKEVLTGLARKFWLKYDCLHLNKLSKSEYEEIVKDIEDLKNRYNYIESTCFSDIVELSKKEPKKG